MSATNTSNKPTTTTTVLYKKMKDVPCLPTMHSTDPQRMGAGFKAVPKFTGRWDPTKIEEWLDFDKKEHEMIKEEAKAKNRWRSKEEKKKSKLTAPIALGSGKGKGKVVEEVQVIDSDSDVDMEF
ncbi:hypothetical protein M422DRAFT_246007 [Sphaerobolus stellatus SS14]|nr:hypothetical protein M422DRAFT_246007 [Sphaerobolus stellatus SS14]